MEIQALKLHIPEQTLNAMAADLFPPSDEVRDLQVRLAPEGVYVSGVYRTMFVVTVGFETLWEPTVRGGKVAARLVRFQARGFNAMMLKDVIMGTISQAVEQEDALWVEEDTILLDPDRLLAKRGFPVRTNLTAIRCNRGHLVIESG